jgi:hypothetical protein
LHEESLAIGRKHHIQRVVEAQEFRYLGILAILEEDFDRATSLLSESIRLFHRQGGAIWVVRCLMSFADLAVLERQPARAATISGAIDLAIEQRRLGIPAVDRTRYDLAIVTARHELGDDRWIAAWAQGRTMSLDDVVAFVTVDTRLDEHPHEPLPGSTEQPSA